MSGPKVLRGGQIQPLNKGGGRGKDSWAQTEKTQQSVRGFLSFYVYAAKGIP